MMARSPRFPLGLFTVIILLLNTAQSLTLSSRLVHRLSDEAKSTQAKRISTSITITTTTTTGNNRSAFLELKNSSFEFYKVLYENDMLRQRKLLFPFEGTQATSFGNDLSWLYYTWIDIGTPNVPFLVALDTGSDLLWVPCECDQCAPLSSSQYGNLDRDLNEYHLSSSSTSKQLPCSHQLCDSTSSCHSSRDPCAYSVGYLSADTSTSGLLVEDVLHLASGRDDTSNTSVLAPVIFGCGMKQTGGYLDGAAPDGVMGLGLGEISVLTYLAKLGLVKNTFTLCFNKDFSGRIYFGDQGPETQQSTPFLPLDEKYKTYIVGVETCCIGNSCLKQTSFRALMDSGSSFSFMPKDIYNQITEEFHRHVNATRDTSQDSFEYCYRTSSNELPNFPALKFVFSPNNTFVVQQPVLTFDGKQGVNIFCLALKSTYLDIGVIGQNYMTGYHMVFDRENLKLSWSESDCENLSDDKNMPFAPKSAPPNPVPTTKQKRAPSEHAVSPAIAGRAHSEPSAATGQIVLSQYLLQLLPLLILSFPSLVLDLHANTGTI